MERTNSYKKTEVGVIPEDWEVKRVGDIADVGRGRVISQTEINSSLNQKYPVYSSQTTNSGIMGYIDTYDFEGEYVTWTTDGVNAGRVFYRNGKFNCTNVCGTIKLKKDDHSFVANMLNALTSKFVSKNLANPKLMNNVMKKIQIPLPPLQEQKAIAKVLSDVDELITSIEELIDKKQNIKQGTMQLLLTGKKRLPGFTEEWEVKTLYEAVDCLDNLRVPLNETQRASMKGDYPYCGANGVLDYINQYIIDDDIILIAEDGGHFDEYMNKPIAYRISGKCWVNNHAHILKAKEHICQDFIFYSLVHKNILEYLSGGTRAKLNKSELFKIEIYIPNSLSEQKAIAQILSDIDLEIEALEKKLEKYKLIKDGMMEQLLTGKVRLI